MIVLHSNHPELLKGQKVWPYHDDDAIVVGKVRIIKPDITLHEREEEMSIEGFCYLEKGDEKARFIIVFLKEGCKK